jgi:hypothetical protein
MDALLGRFGLAAALMPEVDPPSRRPACPETADDTDHDHPAALTAPPRHVEHPGDTVSISGPIRARNDRFRMLMLSDAAMLILSDAHCKQQEGKSFILNIKGPELPNKYAGQTDATGAAARVIPPGPVVSPGRPSPTAAPGCR